MAKAKNEAAAAAARAKEEAEAAERERARREKARAEAAGALREQLRALGPIIGDTLEAIDRAKRAGVEGTMGELGARIGEHGRAIAHWLRKGEQVIGGR